MNHGGSERLTVKPQQSDTSQVKVRLAPPLKTWLQQQAAAARRSLSAEIELRLEASRTHQEADSGRTAPQ